MADILAGLRIEHSVLRDKADPEEKLLFVTRLATMLGITSHWREMTALAISLLKMASKCSFTPSKLRFLEHFRLDLASLVYFALATRYC